MPSTVNVGPPTLGLSVTTTVPLSPLMLHVLSLYADAIASNLKDDVNEMDTNTLKIKLATLIESEGGSWESTNGALQICRKTSEKDLVSKVGVTIYPSKLYQYGFQVMDIVVSHGHVVPEDVQSWSSCIMVIAKDMTSEGVAILKNQCSPSVWAMLVFLNIWPMPARVLHNETVGKTKISDWDLFPSPIVKPVGCLLDYICYIVDCL
ncbi:hypothetical protein EDD85DRAFT_946546 [Armillaria nabsnona]|nr:hypothetical protein EDD85DRAFT_946546 [Armillaria nabsnona]